MLDGAVEIFCIWEEVTNVDGLAGATGTARLAGTASEVPKHFKEESR